MGPFEVTKELVSRLDDGQLRRLLERLLVAEANRKAIPHSGIFVGGNQTAGDGGVDASIQWNGIPAPDSWLPRRRIYYQCKAEGMASAKLLEEMRPNDKPRAIFAELAAAQGAYIIFSTDDPTKSGLDKRLATMAKAVAGVENSKLVHLEFYGADKIARWANQHPGVALWLLELSGRALGGWRPYDAWSAPESSSGPYLLDDSVRAALGETLVETTKAIEAVREKLNNPGGIVRLVGMSGMGKTRLAEALFDDRIGSGPGLSKTKAIYGDSGRDLAIGAARVAEELVLAGVEAVLVVDNCTVQTHAHLADIARRSGSRISLLTIDYDMRGEKPFGLVVTLGENSELVLMSVLKQRVPNLSDAECRHLAGFSGGNVRIALKIAEGAAEGVDLSTLDDSELLERLFQTGRQATDPQARACADAAALVYAFYVEAADHQEPEHPVLAAIAGVHVDTFFRNIATFLDWGVIQQRGPQRAVMPPPLANMLAGPFIRRSDPNNLLDHFLGSSPRLLASFARRLGQLHNEPAAVRLVGELLGPGGPFGEPAALDELARRGFTNMAPAAPEVTLAAFERSLVGPTRLRLLDPYAAGRGDYPQLLVHLAHDQVLFARAMEVLLAFALADDDAKSDRQAKKHFLERFWPRLSFTLADQDTRLAFLDRLIDDEADAVRALGVRAIDHMLNAGYVSSSLNLEFGAKAHLTEWRPAGRDGYRRWFGAALDRATRIAVTDVSEAPCAREIIAHHFREHLDIGLSDLAVAAMRRARGKTYWDAGWRAVCEGLHFSGEALDRPVRSEISALERELRPSTLKDCFEAFVLGEPWRHWHPVHRERRITRNVQRLAKAVGVRLARSDESAVPYLEKAVCAKGQTSVWQFGEGLAWACRDLPGLWDTARSIFAARPDTERHSNVLAGILEGASRRDRTLVDGWLDAAITSPLLGKHFVVLQLAVPLDSTAMARFSRALGHGAIPVWQLSNLQFGSVTKPVPAQALADFLAELYRAEGGILPALQVLHMRIYGDRSDKIEVDTSLIAVGRKFLADARTFAEDNVQEDHGIATIAKVALQGEGGRDTAIATCLALHGDADVDKYYSREFDKVCGLLMAMYPRVVFDEIVAKDARDSLLSRFFGGHALNDDDVDQAKIKLDETVALEWVAEEPGTRAKRLAELVPYTIRDEATGLLSWSSLAIQLIEVGPDPVAVLCAFENRFFTGSGSGSFAGRFVRRRPLVAALLGHEDVRVRNWARAAGDTLEASVRRWDERERGHESRFE